MTEIVKTISSLTTDETYTIQINTKNKTVTCTCLGFQGYGRCKHIKIYRDYIQKTLYPDYKNQVITSFHNCGELIIKLIEQHPNIIYDYNDLVEEVHKHRKYSCETITRAYRRLKEEKEIVEPDDLKIKRQETEHVFHDINQWRPDIIMGGQTKFDI